MFRFFLCFIGILFALPLLVLVVVAFTLPVTISGLAYLSGAVIASSGLILAPRIEKFYVLVASGIFLLLLVASIRLFLVQNTVASIKVLQLPQGKETSWINTLVDEQDMLIFGETIFHWIGGDSDREHAGLPPAFVNVYSEMRKEGSFPSPIISTYLNQQQPGRFDAVIIEPDTTPRFGVVFLHGYMGNVTAQCWVIARAVKELGGITVCPSTIWTGEWWKPDGQEILQGTFDYLKERGIHAIYLGGFSNGGFSTGRLASVLANEKDLRGLIFMDGFMNGSSIRELGLPVLIIEGTQDERVPVESARQFAQEVGELATYKTVNSDHFLIVKQPSAVQEILIAWLRDQESTK